MSETGRRMEPAAAAQALLLVQNAKMCRPGDVALALMRQFSTHALSERSSGGGAALEFAGTTSQPTGLDWLAGCGGKSALLPVTPRTTVVAASLQTSVIVAVDLSPSMRSVDLLTKHVKLVDAFETLCKLVDGLSEPLRIGKAAVDLLLTVVAVGAAQGPSVLVNDWPLRRESTSTLLVLLFEQISRLEQAAIPGAGNVTLQAGGGESDGRALVRLLRTARGLVQCVPDTHWARIVLITDGVGSSEHELDAAMALAHELAAEAVNVHVVEICSDDPSAFHINLGYIAQASHLDAITYATGGRRIRASDLRYDVCSEHPGELRLFAGSGRILDGSLDERPPNAFHEALLVQRIVLNESAESLPGRPTLPALASTGGPPRSIDPPRLVLYAMGSYVVRSTFALLAAARASAGFALHAYEMQQAGEGGGGNATSATTPRRRGRRRLRCTAVFRLCVAPLIFVFSAVRGRAVAGPGGTDAGAASKETAGAFVVTTMALVPSEFVALLRAGDVAGGGDARRASIGAVSSSSGRHRAPTASRAPASSGRAVLDARVRAIRCAVYETMQADGVAMQVAETLAHVPGRDAASGTLQVALVDANADFMVAWQMCLEGLQRQTAPVVRLQVPVILAASAEVSGSLGWSVQFQLASETLENSLGAWATATLSQSVYVRRLHPVTGILGSGAACEVRVERVSKFLAVLQVVFVGAFSSARQRVVDDLQRHLGDLVVFPARPLHHFLVGHASGGRPLRHFGRFQRWLWLDPTTGKPWPIGLIAAALQTLRLHEGYVVVSQTSEAVVFYCELGPSELAALGIPSRGRTAPIAVQYSLLWVTTDGARALVTEIWVEPATVALAEYTPDCVLAALSQRDVQFWRVVYGFEALRLAAFNGCAPAAGYARGLTAALAEVSTAIPPLLDIDVSRLLGNARIAARAFPTGGSEVDSLLGHWARELERQSGCVRLGRAWNGARSPELAAVAERLASEAGSGCIVWLPDRIDGCSVFLTRIGESFGIVLVGAARAGAGITHVGAAVFVCDQSSCLTVGSVEIVPGRDRPVFAPVGPGALSVVLNRRDGVAVDGVSTTPLVNQTVVGDTVAALSDPTDPNSIMAKLVAPAMHAASVRAAFETLRSGGRVDGDSLRTHIAAACKEQMHVAVDMTAFVECVAALGQDTTAVAATVQTLAAALQSALDGAFATTSKKGGTDEHELFYRSGSADDARSPGFARVFLAVGGREAEALELPVCPTVTGWPITYTAIRELAARHERGAFLPVAVPPAPPVRIVLQTVTFGDIPENDQMNAARNARPEMQTAVANATLGLLLQRLQDAQGAGERAGLAALAFAHVAGLGDGRGRGATRAQVAVALAEPETALERLLARLADSARAGAEALRLVRLTAVGQDVFLVEQTPAVDGWVFCRVGHDCATVYAWRAPARAVAVLLRPRLEAACALLNTQCLLEDLSRTHMASPFLIQPLAMGASARMSDEDEGGAGKAGGPLAKDEAGPVEPPWPLQACARVWERRLWLHWRIRPGHALNVLGVSLQGLAVLNQQDTFVFATASGVFFVRCRETAPGGALPNTSGSTGDAAGEGRGLALEFYGLEPVPFPELHEFAALVEGRLRHYLQPVIQMALARHSKATEADAEFLIPLAADTPQCRTAEATVSVSVTLAGASVGAARAIMQLARQTAMQVCGTSLAPLQGSAIGRRLAAWAEARGLANAAGFATGASEFFLDDFGFGYTFAATASADVGAPSAVGSATGPLEAAVGQGLACACLLPESAPDTLLQRLDALGSTERLASVKIAAWAHGNASADALVARLQAVVVEALADFAVEAAAIQAFEQSRAGSEPVAAVQDLGLALRAAAELPSHAVAASRPMPLLLPAWLQSDLLAQFATVLRDCAGVLGGLSVWERGLEAGGWSLVGAGALEERQAATGASWADTDGGRASVVLSGHATVLVVGLGGMEPTVATVATPLAAAMPPTARLYDPLSCPRKSLVYAILENGVLSLHAYNVAPWLWDAVQSSTAQTASWFGAKMAFLESTRAGGAAAPPEGAAPRTAATATSVAPEAADALQMHAVHFFEALAPLAWAQVLGLPEVAGPAAAASPADVLRRTRLLHFCRIPLFVQHGRPPVMPAAAARAFFDEQLETLVHAYAAYLLSPALGFARLPGDGARAAAAAAAAFLPRVAVAPQLVLEAPVLYLCRAVETVAVVAQVAVAGSHFCVNLYTITRSGGSGAAAAPADNLPWAVVAHVTDATYQLKRLIHVNSFVYDYHVRFVQRCATAHGDAPETHAIDVVGILRPFLAHHRERAGFARNAILRGHVTYNVPSNGSQVSAIVTRHARAFGFSCVHYGDEHSAVQQTWARIDASQAIDTAPYELTLLVEPSADATATAATFAYALLVVNVADAAPLATALAEPTIARQLAAVHPRLTVDELVREAERRVANLISRATSFQRRLELWAALRARVLGAPHAGNPRMPPASDHDAHEFVRQFGLDAVRVLQLGSLLPPAARIPGPAAISAQLDPSWRALPLPDAGLFVMDPAADVAVLCAPAPSGLDLVLVGHEVYPDNIPRSAERLVARIITAIQAASWFDSWYSPSF